MLEMKQPKTPNERLIEKLRAAAVEDDDTPKVLSFAQVRNKIKPVVVPPKTVK
jgi:hypothetical protein